MLSVLFQCTFFHFLISLCFGFFIPTLFPFKDFQDPISNPQILADKKYNSLGLSCQHSQLKLADALNHVDAGVRMLQLRSCVFSRDSKSSTLIKNVWAPKAQKV